MKTTFVVLALIGAASAKEVFSWHRPIEYTELTMIQTEAGTGKHKIKLRKIYDADGDGVEDNVEKTWEELDRFYDPLSFGDAEEINNTHHGSLPGHVRAEEYEEAPTHHNSKLV